MKSKLLASTALAVVLGASAGYAQMQPGEKSGREQGAQQREQSPQGAMPAEKDTQKAEPRGSDQGKGRADRDTQKGQGSAQKDTDRSKGAKSEQDMGRKGTAQKQDDNKKSSAQQDTGRKSADTDRKSADRQKDSDRQKDADRQADRQKDGDRKGTAQKGTDDKSGSQRNASERSKGQDTKSGARVQLSDQQRGNVRERFQRERVERVTNVNFNISIGTRIPRSVRLHAVPVAVFEIVPEYRNYRYIMVRDEICIVDPETYEIVYVIDSQATTAGGGGGGNRLSLSDEQRSFVLRNVDLKSEARLGIGGISIGIDVPRDAQVVEFPTVVIEKLPELRSYRYFAFENDIAIVDPQSSKVELVIEGGRR